jgi:hypothetical protein
MASKDRLETIGSFTGPLEAHLAKGRLEAEGITAHIAHEHHIWAVWAYSNALGGVKIQVDRKDAVQAREILRDLVEGKYEDDLKAEFPDLKEQACPRCGSTRFESRIPLVRIPLAIFTLGIGFTFPMRREIHRCLQCGKRWRS